MEKITVTRKFPVYSNGLHGEVAVQLSLFGLSFLTHPLNSLEQHTRANLEFSSNFGKNQRRHGNQKLQADQTKFMSV